MTQDLMETFVLHVPVRLQRTGGRVLVLAPTELRQLPDDIADLKALTAIATAFHWQAQLDSGKYSSLRRLAADKGVHHSYVWKLLKLVYLDPYIIRQLLDGRQPSGFSISEVLRYLPFKWEEQRTRFGFSNGLIRHTNQRHLNGCSV